MASTALGDREQLAREELLVRQLESYTGREIPNLGLDHLHSIFSGLKAEFQRRQVKIVTVAGTNGKGETAYSLAHLLREQGVLASVWSSPHILSLRERFIIDHDWVELAALEVELSAVIKQKLALTYYEILFYVFCQLALKSKSEVLILEVGLGGRLDAVNLFDADVTLLTSLSRDHMLILGHRYELILKEKLGVVRKAGIHFSALKSRYLQEKQRDFMPAGAKFYDLFADQLLSCDVSYRISNRALAYCAFVALRDGPQALPIDVAALVEKKHWPTFKGRFEKMTDGVRTFIFIGAHNPDGFRAMTHALAQSELRHLSALVAFSARELREIKACLKTLTVVEGLIDHLVLTAFDHPRSWKLSADEKEQLVRELAAFQKRMSVTYQEDCWPLSGPTFPPNEHQNILVCGSYYFVGAVERALLAQSYQFC